MTQLTHDDLFPGASRNTLHYRGDLVDHILTTQQRWGPDMFGALYEPQSATYDQATDTTTVRFLPKAAAQKPPPRRQARYQMPTVNPDGNRKHRRHKGKKR
ncbi:hypothetical protein E3G52_000300 [Mycobacteroides abscessus]|uniref:hypothetical protein n=1 Tax=Mycobacteroides abscessus TaxID=36809 RepID=UPI0018787A1A|nr:hypothetical protein [Mycobacteroides abscessus]MBE5453436.1 hypothetical protein [Mycobacteroides abscessus]